MTFSGIFMLFSSPLEAIMNSGTFPENGQLHSRILPETPLLKPEKLIVSFQNYSGSHTHVQAFHQRCVLKVHLKGKSMAHVDGNRFLLSPGSGILIFPFQLHFIGPGGDREQYRLLVEFSLSVEDLDAISPLKNHPFQLDDEDLFLLQRLVDKADRLDSAGTSYCFAEFLTRRLQKNGTGILSPESPGNDKFNQIFHYIQTHLDQPLSLKTLCEQFHLSEKSLRGIFRKNLGPFPLGGQLRSLRLHRAAEYLLYTDRSIGEISALCGYTDSFVFSRSFKSFSGLCPRAYRKQHLRP